MKRYPNYSANGLPWCAEFPSHWKFLRAKFMYKKENRPVRPEDKVVTCFRDGEVTLRENRRVTGFTEAIQENGYQGIRKGDLVIHVMDAFAGSIGVSDSDGKGTPVYSVCTALGDYNNYYYAYVLRVMAKSGFIQSLYKGIRERSSDFRFEVFANQVLPVPPREEQEQIVRFLDWKVSAINRMIACRHRQMDLIDEHFIRQADDVIFHGSQNAALKNSRFSWIGEIPQHWATIKIKWLFNEDDARNENGTAELLTFSRKRGLIPYSEATERPSVTDLSKYRLVKPGQLLENRLQAWSGMFICVTRHGCISPDYSVFNANPNRDVNVKFYEYVFRSPRQVAQFANASRGVGEGFNRLYTPAFGAIETIYPPIEEQNEIVEYLDQLKEKHVAISKKIEEELTCLEELKTRLISDVVTGKLDVRGVDVP